MLTKVEVPFEVKSSDDAGSFEGYASVFNNIDSGNDIILPGAFSQVKTTRQGRLKLALYHDLTRLIGSAEFHQDDHGLFLKGRVNLNVSYARDAYELMKEGTLDSMSIGLMVLEATFEDRSGRNVRVIHDAELWEASVVPFGMNAEAQVISVKSDIRTFENALRERMGLSQKEAAAIASVGYPVLHRDGASAATEIVEDLKEVGNLIDKYFRE